MKRPINDLGPIIMRDCLDRNEKLAAFKGTYRPFMSGKDLARYWLAFLAVCAFAVWVVENN